MSPQPRRVDVTLETKIESMDLGEEVARRVAATAGFDEDERDKICMAVRECLINALQHRNPPHPPPPTPPPPPPPPRPVGFVFPPPPRRGGGGGPRPGGRLRPGPGAEP